MALTLSGSGSVGGLIAPAFSAYLATTNQTFASSVDTVMAMNAEEFDTNSCYDTGTYRFTPNVPGYYQIQGSVFHGDSTGTVSRAFARIYKNGAVHKTGSDANGATKYSSDVQALIYLNGTTDYVTLRMFIICTTPTARFGLDNTYFSGFLARAAA